MPERSYDIEITDSLFASGVEKVYLQSGYIIVVSVYYRVVGKFRQRGLAINIWIVPMVRSLNPPSQ